MSARDIEYFTKREREERENAARTDDLTARRVHQEMAERYSALLRDILAAPPVAQA
ncbi:hypothetical protein P6144_18365 [Sphingomonas sp. HITSZ_GF]|uniref:hypothetical protein n=1 Tax=Sphingomonas sp. HITSZ_GF TaxID=3037247 RepID=UPI00240DFBC1|nr:hypothetical protein [Sphingomonas sp. HITSZ_GF]MDG2535632.1 hypothetical protein [Sphingomonas sp. HITSZ_GF]